MARLDSFLKGIEIMRPYFSDADDFMSADHGDTVFFAYLDELDQASDEGQELLALGFHPNPELECWYWPDMETVVQPEAIAA